MAQGIHLIVSLILSERVCENRNGETVLTNLPICRILNFGIGHEIGHFDRIEKTTRRQVTRIVAFYFMKRRLKSRNIIKEVDIEV